MQQYPTDTRPYGWLIALQGAQTPNAPIETIRTLLAAALVLFDRVLAMNPDDHWALGYKALTLKAQALRVEQDPVRVQALKDEAERLLARPPD
jgi:hypothetical protein